MAMGGMGGRSGDIKMQNMNGTCKIHLERINPDKKSEKTVMVAR